MPINLVAYCAAEIGVSAQVVRRIAVGAPRMYKKFHIPKRNGVDFRVVAQPAREVKALQRAIVKFASRKCPIHHCATAYVEGASVAKNAARHRGAPYLLKLDFSDFFGSIKSGDVRIYLAQAFNDASDIELDLMARTVTWYSGVDQSLSLCIGAPSSPFFSNAIMFDFDCYVQERCERLSVSYTRYSDDLTFSGSTRADLVEIETRVREFILMNVSPLLTINEKKRVLVGRTSSMRVTGVHLSTQGEVTVGRVRKRGIRSGIRKFLKNALTPDGISKLKGEIAFAVDVEPSIVALIYDWYGGGVSPLIPKTKRAPPA